MDDERETSLSRNQVKKGETKGLRLLPPEQARRKTSNAGTTGSYARRCRAARALPSGGLLVFFPSYGAMDDAVHFWKRTGLYRDLEATGKAVVVRAAQGCELLNFQGSYLGQFPLVSAHFWTSDHLSSSSRTVHAFLTELIAKHSS